MKTMMVLGDTHKNFFAIDYLLPRMKECDYVIHLGDNEKDMHNYKKELGDKLITVKGNNDSLFDDEKVLEVEGVKFLIVHGNKYKVKENLNKINAAVIEKECQVALYGHTHKAAIDDFDEATFISPGTLEASAVNKTYAYIVVSDGKVMPKIVDIKA